MITETLGKLIETVVLIHSFQKEVKKLGVQELQNETEPLTFSVQVFQEFYVQATRPSAGRVAPDVAIALIRSWTRFPVQQMTVDLMFAALSAHRRFGISYWDAAIIEAARSLGCLEVFTEDLQDDQSFSGVRTVNPFK